MVQTKTKISTQLMAAELNYNKQCLYQAGYFREQLVTHPNTIEGKWRMMTPCSSLGPARLPWLE